MKLYQLFDELQGHESNVAQTLYELTGGRLALVSSYDPQTPNLTVSDPFIVVVPYIPPVQPSPPIIPAPTNTNYQSMGDLNPEEMDFELRFQQEFSLLSIR